MSFAFLIRVIYIPFFVLSILGIFCTQNLGATGSGTQNQVQSGSTSGQIISSSGSTSSGGAQSISGSILSGSTQPISNSTGSTSSTSSGNVQTGTTQSSSIGSVIPVSSGSTQTGSNITFPEIIPQLQRWSYVSLSENVLTCEKEICRINLNFESIFSVEFPKKEYFCEITFENEIIKKCNPSQWTLTGASEFEIVLTHKKSGKTSQKHFEIYYPFTNTQTGTTQTGTTQTGTTQTGTTQTGTTNSGNTQNTNLPILDAQKLSYADSDNDGKIDTIFAQFSESLTGSYVTGTLMLYSNTGGLYQSKINTQSDMIQSVTASGNTLIIKIIPSDFEKKILTISASTSSDLRLKNTKDIGFFTLSGASLKKFGLTTSFEKYTQITHPEIEFFAFENYTGSTDFPQITPTLQRATDGYLSGNTLICDRSDCRVNLSLENLFTGVYLKNNFECRIQFGTGEILDTCNPPQYTISNETHFQITLIHKEKGEGIIQIFPISIEPKYSVNNDPTDTNPPVIVLEMDGKWKKYYEQIDEYHLRCHTNTCSLNFTAEDSYDPEGSKLRFMWLYDFLRTRDYNTLKTSKDPGSVKFGLGTHEIQLKVMDANGNFSRITYIIEVVGKKEKKRKEKQKKKKRAINELILPEIVIQNQKYVRKTTSGIYVCESVRKTCSVNFSLSGTMKGGEYEWNIGGKSHITKNPRSQKLSLGVHTGSLILRDKISKKVLWRQSFEIRVLQKKKIKISQKIDLENFPTPKIIIQNPKHLSWKSDGNLLCKSTRKTCSANFKIQDPIKGIEYIWYFDHKKVVSKNPRSHKFSLGNHTVRLKVKHQSRVLFEKAYKVQVFRSKKPKKIYPFKIPQIVIQNPKYLSQKHENLYICTSQKETCSANFKLKNTVRGYTYFWQMNEKNIKSKNPRSQKFSAGEYVVVLTAKNAYGKKVWKKSFMLQVKTKDKSQESLQKTDNYTLKNEQKQEKPPSTAHISFLSILLGMMLFWRRV